MNHRNQTAAHSKDYISQPGLFLGAAEQLTVGQCKLWLKSLKGSALLS